MGAVRRLSQTCDRTGWCEECRWTIGCRHFPSAFVAVYGVTPELKSVYAAVVLGQYWPVAFNAVLNPEPTRHGDGRRRVQSHSMFGQILASDAAADGDTRRVFESMGPAAQVMATFARLDAGDIDRLRQETDDPHLRADLAKYAEFIALREKNRAAMRTMLDAFEARKGKPGRPPWKRVLHAAIVRLLLQCEETRRLPVTSARGKSAISLLAPVLRMSKRALADIYERDQEARRGDGKESRARLRCEIRCAPDCARVVTAAEAAACAAEGRPRSCGPCDESMLDERGS